MNRCRQVDGLALTPYFFDLLHLDGADLLDAPGRERWAALAEAVPAALRVPRTMVDDAGAGRRRPTPPRSTPATRAWWSSRPTAPYDAGRRGAAWVKVKPRHTLDLVVLAVEWGHGRRTGWLSNLHLGARDPRTGGFVMLGKTFKGLTDELLRWQTERFQELAVERGDWVVTGPARAGGRDRVRRGADAARAIRAGWRCASPGCCATATTRPAAEADTIDTVRAIYNGRS